MSKTKDVRDAMLETARLLRENANDDCSAIQQAIYWEGKAAALEPAPKPAGGEWVLVPREPTEVMISAGYDEEKVGYGPDGVPAELVYAAMISAAPPPPSTAPEPAPKPVGMGRGRPCGYPCSYDCNGACFHPSTGAVDVGKLVAALKWYASDEAWTIEQTEGSNGDYGTRARAALAAYKRSTTDD